MVKLAVLPLAFILQVIPADGTERRVIIVSGGAGFGPRRTFRTIASSTAAGLTFSSAPDFFAPFLSSGWFQGQSSPLEQRPLLSH